MISVSVLGIKTDAASASSTLTALQHQAWSRTPICTFDESGLLRGQLVEWVTPWVVLDYLSASKNTLAPQTVTRFAVLIHEPAGGAICGSMELKSSVRIQSHYVWKVIPLSHSNISPWRMSIVLNEVVGDPSLFRVPAEPFPAEN